MGGDTYGRIPPHAGALTIPTRVSCATDNGSKFPNLFINSQNSNFHYHIWIQHENIPSNEYKQLNWSSDSSDSRCDFGTTIQNCSFFILKLFSAQIISFPFKWFPASYPGEALNFFQVGVCGPDFRSVGLANFKISNFFSKGGLVNWFLSSFFWLKWDPCELRTGTTSDA